MPFMLLMATVITVNRGINYYSVPAPYELFHAHGLTKSSHRRMKRALLKCLLNGWGNKAQRSGWLGSEL